MRLLGKLWVSMKEFMENRDIQKAKQREIRKYNDPRRVAIHSKVELTEEQKNAIDKLYGENYGQTIPHTWHKHFTAFTGKFDVNYFPELLYIPAFERLMNLQTAYCKVVSDKNLIPMLAASAGVKMPKTLFSCTAGMYRDGEGKHISRDQALTLFNNLGECFAKPSVDSGSGKNAMLLNMQGGMDLRSNRTAEQILSVYDNDFVVQQRIKCHKSIADIYDGALNSFRVVTYRWKDEIRHMPVTLRIAQNGSYLDAAHAGGVFIAVNEDGTLQEKAYTEFKKEFTAHPDSGVVFKGYKIEHFDSILKSAVKMHEAIPQVGCINWDYALDESGEPVMIEANTLGGGFWITEMAHGCGPFGEHTAEVLRWMRAIENAPRDQQHHYYYGHMGDL